MRFPLSGKPTVESTSMTVEPTDTEFKTFVLLLGTNSLRIVPLTVRSLWYP